MSSPQATPRRVRIERGIYKRGDGKFEIGFRDSLGVQRWQVVPDGGIRAARLALAEVKARMGRGERVAPVRNLTFEKAASAWWEQQATALRPATQSAYGASLHGYLIPAWGRRKLDDLDVNTVALLIRDMQAKGRKAWTIRGVLTVAGRIFDFAVRRMGWAGQNPVRLLDRSERPKSDTRERRILSGPELHALLDVAEPPYALIFKFAAGTGCRLGEVLGVKWRSIDFDSGTASITHQLDRRGEYVELKTRRSRRTVELPGWLTTDLRAHKLASPYSADSDYIFTTAKGTPHDHRNVGGRALSRAIERAGIDTATQHAPTMHSLRHGFASAFIASGGDLVELSALLGHRDPSVTASVYSHEFEKAARSDARRSRIESMYGAMEAPVEANGRSSTQQDADSDSAEVLPLRAGGGSAK